MGTNEGEQNIETLVMWEPADGGAIVQTLDADEARAPGNITIQTGVGFAGGKAGPFVWKFGGNDVPLLKVDPDGACFVRGKQVDLDVDFYKTVREWFAKAAVYSPPAKPAATTRKIGETATEETHVSSDGFVGVSNK